MYVCSVVIPTYNAAATLPDQLEALAGQTTTDAFEVLVVDNRSSDDPAAIVTAWRDRLPGLRLVDASRGQGVSVARNVGIANATTDWILICEADDVVSPTWLDAFTSALRTHALVGGPVETQRLSGASASWTPVPSHADDLLELWGCRYPIGANLGLRREVFDAVGGFDEGYPAGAEEIDFAWRAAEAGYVAAFVPDALVHYRIKSMVRSVARQQFTSGLGMAMLYAKFRPPAVSAKSPYRRIRHELILLQRFPWRGGRDARIGWLLTMAFEAGKLVGARRHGVSAP